VFSNSVQIERATLLLEQGRVSDAIKELKTFLQQEPENDHALSIYARCYFKKKDFDKGIETILQAIRIDPENSYYFYLLGFGYYRKNNHAAAINNINKAVSMNPYTPEYYGMLSHVYIAEKDFQTALLKANEGLALDAENINCLNARSIALNKLKQTDAAIETMQNALAKDPENEATHATVGWNYLEKGKHKDAATHFREALRINPTSESGREGLKEALKSKIPPYRWILQYSFWINNKGKRTTRFFPVMIFVVVRILASALASNNTTMILGGIIIGLYFLFVITTWIINPLANFFLLFYKDGKYALNNSEKWSAITTVLSIGFGILLLTFGFIFSRYHIYQSLLISGIAFLGMAVPLGQLEFPLSWKLYGIKNKISLILVSLALITIFTAFISPSYAVVPGFLFLVLFVLNTWFNVFNRKN
jgi:tetratricopeptide (TPR) repeat protein